MTVAYVDTSFLVAIAFGERGASQCARRLASFGEVLSANLLEAELRAACRRERIEAVPAILGLITWVLPAKPLAAEIGRVLTHGYLRGADAWHLATALYVADEPASMTFLTLDVPQREVAAALGFVV